MGLFHRQIQTAEWFDNILFLYNFNLFLRATLPKILISNFHPEIDFAHNSSINFTWQVGNKYEIISEKVDFLKIFLIGTFVVPECAQNVAVNSRILRDLQLSVLKNTDHSKALTLLVINNDPLS